MLACPSVPVVMVVGSPTLALPPGMTGSELHIVVLYINGRMCGLMSSPSCLAMLIQVMKATPTTVPIRAPCMQQLKNNGDVNADIHTVKKQTNKQANTEAQCTPIHGYHHWLGSSSSRCFLITNRQVDTYPPLSKGH